MSSNFKFSITPHKNVWEGYFQKHGHEFRLIFSTTPGEIALFLDKYRPPKKSNVLNFFEELENKRVSGIELADGDRFLSIRFDDRTDLLFQLFGNNANIFMIQEDAICDAFKDREKLKGIEPPKPRKPVPKGDPPEKASARQLILHYDIKFPRHLIKPVIDHYQLNESRPAEVEPVVNKLKKALTQDPAFRILKKGQLCFIPEALLPADTLKICESANEAVRFVYYKASHLRRFEKKLKNIQPALENKLKKTRQTLRQLEGAGKTLERAEKYQKFGHLLMSQAHRQRDPASGKLEVPDFYNNNQPVKIPLKDNLSIAENARHYYEKSARAERHVEESKRRRKDLLQEADQLEKLYDSLNSIGNLYELEDWIKDHDRDLHRYGIVSTGEQKRSEPYKATEFDGYEIRIGKNAKSNDQLTKLAHKEDIWLHARGAGGSHVLIRTNNNPDMPPKHVIRKAASYAAWHSKLRGSDLVPVIVTKKKYVIKPKGAPPGMVRVDREDVEMVKPEEP